MQKSVSALPSWLHGRRYERVDEAIAHRLGLPGRQMDLVAQEVQAAFPDRVAADDEGYLYITQRGTTTLMVEAVRKLRAEIDAAIGALQTKNRDLRRRLDRLAAILDRIAATEATD